MNWDLRSFASVLLLILILSGCGAAASTPARSGADGFPAPTGTPIALAASPLEPTRWATPPHQECYSVESPLPPFDSLFDSVRVARAVRSRDGDGMMLMSLRGDSAGIPRPLVVVESSLTVIDAAAMEDSLRSAYRGNDDAAWRGRLLIETERGTAPVFRLGPGQLCKPYLLNAPEIGRYLQKHAGSVRNRGTTWVEVRVDEGGTVIQSRVSRTSGDADVDLAAESMGARMRFLPALYDRSPFSMWVTLPINIR